MMKRVADRFAGAPFAIIGINSDGDRESASRFARSKHMPWQNVADGGIAGPVATEWKIAHWPAVIIVGRDGRVAAVEPADDAIVPIIQRLLGSQSEARGSKHAL